MDVPSGAPFTQIGAVPPRPRTAPATSPTASPTASNRQPKSNRLELKNIQPFGSVSFNSDDTFVASKKLSESAPPPTPQTLFPLLGSPELQQIPSQPTYTNYGMAVDFAGASDDNPLYRGQQAGGVDDNSSGGSAVNVYTKGVAIDQVVGSAAPSDLYQSAGLDRQRQHQPIRPYSPSYDDAIYDEAAWLQSPGDPAPARDASKESEYYYKGVKDYPQSPNYNALHYQSARDQQHYGEDHGSGYRDDRRQHGEIHRESFADGDGYPGNHEQRPYHNKNDADYRDGGEPDYHDEVRAPRPPRNNNNPNEGRSFPERHRQGGGDDVEHRDSSFRQFFGGDGLAALPPKRPRESQKRRDRDRERDRNRKGDRKRREKNKKRRPPPPPPKKKRRNKKRPPPPPPPKKKKKKDTKTLQHLQSDKSRERDKDRRRESTRGTR